MMLALFVTAFIVIPLADAAFCAMEEAAHLSIVIDANGNAVDADQHEKGNPFGSAGPCEHGHCHHTTSHVSAAISDTNLSSRPVHRWPGYEAAVSRTPDRLMRPPKA